MNQGSAQNDSLTAGLDLSPGSLLHLAISVVETLPVHALQKRSLTPMVKKNVINFILGVKWVIGRSTEPLMSAVQTACNV
ncbi:hypothetical protein PR048_015627 [Dryococelus australis]|uniref:Uncharacterized protein n=1 Tax=Dryococelus australis TaxID=614101 RepID=A0ABQ9HHH3_9NEOP|nr:hypothetical protein PR048_015627 [Dryococelus australis]